MPRLIRPSFKIFIAQVIKQSNRFVIISRIENGIGEWEISLKKLIANANSPSNSSNYNSKRGTLIRENQLKFEDFTLISVDEYFTTDFANINFVKFINMYSNQPDIVLLNTNKKYIP